MDNKTIALNFLQAADKNDYASVEKLFGPRHQFYSTMSPVPMDRSAHLGMLQAFQSGFSNTRHEVLDLLESGNKVTIRGGWHGRHTGEFNKIPPSGNNVHLSFIMIIEVEDEEMINHWIELDSMSMMIQLGAMQAPSAA